MTNLPEVLLIDDDDFIVRFVQMALEDLPLQLSVCQRLEHARARVAQARFDLLICDQMLPDGQGLDFLEALRRGALPGQTPADVAAVMFSAGILGEQRERAIALGVKAVLLKPVSIAELTATVMDALKAHDQAHDPVQWEPVQDAEPGAGSEDELARLHFAGNVTLYRAFLTTVREQIPEDIARGDQAVQALAWPDLRRLAHSLKTVLPMVGDVPGGTLARQLEGAAHRADPSATAMWRQLREHLGAVLRQG